MKKRITILTAAIILVAAALCALFTPAEPKAVFDTEDIKCITFRSIINGGGEVEVPAEDMEEIAAWLSSFTVGKRAGKTLAPGTNSVSVRIEYADGRIVESGLSTTKVGRVTYYMTCADAPQSYLQLIS